MPYRDSRDHHHWRQADGFVPAMALPVELFTRAVMIGVAEALKHGEAVTVLGMSGGAAAVCYGTCCTWIEDALVVVPDLVLTELAANGVDLPVTNYVESPDGRSAALWAGSGTAASTAEDGGAVT